MKIRPFSITFSALALAFWGVNATAACTANTQIRNTGNVDALNTLLSGKTVCAVKGQDRWQEEHRPAGQLWDYKLGPSNPDDPSSPVGTWSTAGTGANTIVTYDYGSGLAFVYNLHDNGNGTYDFCTNGAAIVTNATLVPGINVGCAGVPAAPTGATTPSNNAPKNWQELLKLRGAKPK